MPTATVTSGGKITLPVEIRHALKINAGDRVEFVQIASGRYEFVVATSEVTALKGMFHLANKRRSIESMNQTITRRGAAAR